MKAEQTAGAADRLPFSQASQAPRFCLAYLFVAFVLPVGCGDHKPLREDPAPGPPPVPTSMLNAAYTINAGLLTGTGTDGAPTSGAPDSDPMIIEALRFYDTVQTPTHTSVAVDYPDPFTGDNTPERKTAPMTLDAWKATFGFPQSDPQETLQAYRERVGIATYYNRNELGLGRELGCARFVDGADANGNPLSGVACFVTNHGSGFRMEQSALQSAINGTDTRNTVCITYRPSLDFGYQVQFYVYDAVGRRQQWARLDTLGPRPLPQVCMTCHGGAYDDEKHLAKNAHFLPLDPNLVVFAEGDGLPNGVSRASQEERLRRFNVMTLGTPLTDPQRQMLSRLYPTDITAEGSAATGDTVPDPWKLRPTDADFYRGVIKPYCATCHLAGERGLDPQTFWSFGIFASPAAFDAAPLEGYVCNLFSMPNAQPTSLGFWDATTTSAVVVGGQTYPAPVDAFLARRKIDRSSCIGLGDIAGCNRGSSPDALCGGNVSGGATCDLNSDRCLPVSTPAP